MLEWIPGQCKQDQDPFFKIRIFRIRPKMDRIRKPAQWISKRFLRIWIQDFYAMGIRIRIIEGKTCQKVLSGSTVPMEHFFNFLLILLDIFQTEANQIYFQLVMLDLKYRKYIFLPCPISVLHRYRSEVGSSEVGIRCISMLRICNK